MPNICTTNYVIEGKKEELDALYQKMKELQGQSLGQLVEALGKSLMKLCVVETGLTWNAMVAPFA